MCIGGWIRLVGTLCSSVVFERVVISLQSSHFCQKYSNNKRHNRTQVQDAAVLSTKIRVEIELQNEEKNSKPQASELKGLAESQIEVLVLSKRVETLEKAIQTAKGNGVNANEELVKKSIAKLKKLKESLVNANAKEEERLREEEKARLKAMKKGKKGKKGKKKKKKK